MHSDNLMLDELRCCVFADLAPPTHQMI